MCLDLIQLTKSLLWGIELFARLLPCVYLVASFSCFLLRLSPQSFPKSSYNDKKCLCFRLGIFLVRTVQVSTDPVLW